jgi:hypothetical protein
LMHLIGHQGEDRLRFANAIYLKFALLRA